MTTETPLFSARYGIQTHVHPDTPHFATRHSLAHGSSYTRSSCAESEATRCRCIGMAQPAPHQNTGEMRERLRCCATMTGEDLRCDECREYCVYIVDRVQPGREREIKNFPLLPVPERG